MKQTVSAISLPRRPPVDPEKPMKARAYRNSEHCNSTYITQHSHEVRSSHISGIPSPRPCPPDDLASRRRGGRLFRRVVAAAATIVDLNRRPRCRVLLGRLPDVTALVEHLPHHSLQPLEPGGHALRGPVLDGLGRILAEVRAGLLEAVGAWPVLLVSVVSRSEEGVDSMTIVVCLVMFDWICLCDWKSEMGACLVGWDGWPRWFKKGIGHDRIRNFACHLRGQNDETCFST